MSRRKASAAGLGSFTWLGLDYILRLFEKRLALLHSNSGERGEGLDSLAA